MKQICRSIAQFVEHFPGLVVGVLILLSVLLTVSTLAYVAQTPGLGLIIEISQPGAVFVMSTLIVLIFVWLGFRITYVNQYVKKRAYAIARAYRPVSSNERTEQEGRNQARLFLIEFNIKGNIFKKLATIITWHAQLFTYLLIFLTVLYIAILACYYSECEFGRNCQDGNHSWLWRSCPWLAVGLVIVYLAVNDWFIMQAIYKFLRNLLYLAELRQTAIYANKPLRLTPTEQIVYTKRIQEGKRLKEIADEMNVSVGTIKTHINNIGKKLQSTTETSNAIEIK